MVDAGGLRPSRRTTPACDVFTSHPSGAHTGAQRVLGADVQEGVEFLHNRAETSGLDPGGGRRQECAGAGEPDLLVRPQTQFVELRHLVEGVVAATVGVTCPGLVRDERSFSLRNMARLASVPSAAINSGNVAIFPWRRSVAMDAAENSGGLIMAPVRSSLT